MRLCVSAGMLLAAAILVPIAGHAQKFEEPTKQELKMTSDPMAPGAPAVYLYREETTDNNRHFISEYARIKVLTEQGKKWATVEVPYAGTGVPPRIEARTIHPDGTVVLLSGKPEDVLIVKSKDRHVMGAVFNLPSVTVGSILEYRWTLPMVEGRISGETPDEQPFLNSALAGSIPYWQVQTDLFVHKEHFYYNPLSYLSKDVLGNQNVTHYTSDGQIANYLLFSARLPAGAKVDVSPKPDYTLDVENIPAISHEAFAPPEQSRVYGVHFYYTPYLAGDVYWADESKRWAKRVDQAAAPSKDLKAAAAQITVGTTTDLDKAQRLFAAVQALDNTAFSRERSEAERAQRGLSPTVRNAEQVWQEKSGNPSELTTLYLALARAAGLQASAMSVTDRRWNTFDPGFLSMDQLSVDLVVLHIGGKDIFVDPGAKLIPFGQLYWSHMLSGGLLETADGVTHNAITPPNNVKDAIIAHTADLTLDAQGNVTGTVKVLLTGPEALRWRQRGLTSTETAVRQQFNESLYGLLPQGVSGELERIVGLNTAAGFLTFTVQVSGHLGQPAGKRMLLPGFFFSTGAHVRLPADQQRTAPIDMRYADQEINAVVYHLPAGYSVESAPKPVQLPWAGHAALVVQTQSAPGTVTIKHIVARGFAALPATNYQGLRNFYQQVAVNDQQQLVLKH